MLLFTATWKLPLRGLLLGLEHLNLKISCWLLFKLKVSFACTANTKCLWRQSQDGCLLHQLIWGEDHAGTLSSNTIRYGCGICNLHIPEQRLKAVWGWTEVMTWHFDMTYSRGTIVSVCTYCIFMTVRSVLHWREWLMAAAVVPLTPVGLHGSRVAPWLMSSLWDLFCQHFSQTAKQVLGLLALLALLHTVIWILVG